MNPIAALVEWSVRRRGVVLVVSGIVALVALATLRHLSIDAVPDVTNVQVTVITSAPGLSPAEVESYLTHPVEMSMNGLPELDEIRSISRTAVSAVTVVFKDSMNIWLARQLVSERLKMAEADIPPAYGRPELAPVSTGLGEIYEFYLESDHASPMELRTLLDWNVSWKLRTVPGVIEVNAMGGEAKQYQVIVDPKRLAEYHLSLGRILEVLEHNNANVGGGYIEKQHEQVVLRGEAQFKSIDDIAATTVSVDADGTPVQLRQVATVKLGPALRYGVVTKWGKGEIVAGTVMMLIGQNSREVVKNVKDKLVEIQKALPDGVRIVPYYDRAEFIDRTLHTVAVNLSEGALLVVLVLFVTLGTLRGSVLAALAIPLAMGVAVIGMVAFGVTGNLMSLGAIDFGLLVDGAIVMLEAAMSMLEERRPSRAHAPALIAEAMSRAAKPVSFAVAIIMLVYLPLMALEGTEGRMFQPMAITVAMALAGALLFTLTTFPAACAYLLRAPKPHAHEKSMFARLAARYRRLLERVMARPLPLVAAVGIILVVTTPVAASLGAEFVPRIDEGAFAFDIKRLPSISLQEAVRLGVETERVLSRFPEARAIVTRTGRAEVATDPVGFDEVETNVLLHPKDTWTTAHDIDSLGEKMKEAIEREVPATYVSVSQPIEDRVNQLLSGSKADLAIKVFGEDLPTLKAIADQIAEAIRPVAGTGDLRVQRVLGLPLLDVRVDRARIARYGIPASDVLDTVSAARAGVNAGKVFEGARRFDVTVLMPPAAADPEAIGDLLVGGPNGMLVPLSQLADVKLREGAATILREGLERRVLVESNVRGRDLVSYVNDCKARVASIKLPPGYHLEWAGQFANFNRAKNRLMLVVPMALAIIFGMLFLMFGELRSVTAVFACVPLALVGGIISLSLRGMPFSLPAAVGFIALCGVAVLNGVVMASEVNRRRQLGAPQPFLDGAVAVMRPVITTALVAAIGFFPMAMSTHAGGEVQRPLATVVIGGIFSSTLLGLLVLPVLLRRLAGRDDKPVDQPQV